MTVNVILKLLLLFAEALTQQIKQHEKDEYDLRIKAIKKDPRAVFSQRFGRLHNKKSKVPRDSTNLDD